MAYSSDFTRKVLGENKKKNNINNNGTYESDFTRKVLSTYKPIQLPTPTTEINNSNTTNSKESYNTYKQSEKNLNYESNLLRKKYNNAGIVTGSGYIPSNDRQFYLKQDLDNHNYVQMKEDYSNKKYGSSRLIAASEREKENSKKYKEFSKQQDVVEQTNKVNNLYDETANNYYKYLQNKVAEDDVNWWDKTGGHVIRGMISPFTIGRYSLKNENGESYIMPTYDDLKNQKVNDSYETWFGKLVGPAAHEIGKLATSAGMNVLLPGAGTTGYFSNIFSSQLNSAISEGYDAKKAATYATVGSALEIATEKILGGTTNAVFKSGSSELSNTISKGLSKVITNHPHLVSAISSAISEGGEEFIQEYLDKINKNLTLDNTNWNKNVFTKETFEDALYSATLGALTGSITGGISSNEYSTRESSLNTQINNKNSKINELLEKRNNNLADINKVNKIDNKILQNQKDINSLTNDLNNYYKKNKPNNLLPKVNVSIANNQPQNNLENSIVNSAVNNTINENNINLPKINNEVKLPNVNNQNNNIFSKQIDEVLKGTFPKNDMLIVSQNTPKILKDLGLKDLPITLTQKHLDTITNETGKYASANYHNLGIDIVKQLPEALARPLNVIKSSTKENSIVVVTDLSDKNNNIVIASVAIDGTGRINDIKFDSNVMTSAYGKNNYDTWMQKNKDNIIYDIDEGIIKGNSTGIQYPRSTISFSNDNDTTNDIENQVAPLPISNNIQKSEINTDKINIPLKSNVETKNNLSLREQSELTELQNMPFDLDKKQQSRLDYLLNKQQGKQEKLNIKLPELKQVKATEIENKVKKTLQNRSYKTTNEATKTVQQYINFDRIEKKNFKEELMKFSGKSKNELQNAKTYQDVKEIIKKYADREITFVDEELATIKNEIKNYKIKVDDYVKSNMDYNTFRKQNFGKLKLGDEGISIDSAWQELSDMYPQYFDKNVANEFDMLNNLSDFMNQSFKVTENYMLSDSEINDATNRVFDKLLNNSLSNDEIDSLQAYLEDKYNIRTRAMVQQELLDEMNIKIGDLDVGEDIGSIAYQRTDPIRLNEKVFGFKIGQKINDATINQTKHNEAERIRFLNKERSEIENLGIKARSKESVAVQKYAEKSYVNEYGEKVSYTLKDLQSDFPNVETQNKIIKASELLRKKYDTYIDEINEVITSLGYDAIPKRTDYMHHFQELDSKFAEWGLPLSNLNDENLPTDINGLTDQFKPGKNYFAAAMKRKGMKTTYDAITGIDKYLEGASNLIYHTKDIQRYRSLSKLIRETYGQQHGMDNINIFTSEQFNQRLDDIYNGKLSKYVAWLDEQANALAGKKGAIDRGAERVLGRKIYTVLDTAKKQVGSNMTGFNVRSALTNFASAIQGASKTNKVAFLKGTISTFKNIIHNDGMIDKSDFLTSRFGSNQLSQKLWQKASNAGQVFMSGSDYFTANQIWRSKYYENIQKGMTEKQAIKNADDFSARIMGDRSKGTTAEIFNSKTLGLFTQFQLEVNNQWSSMIHDNKIEIANGNKTKTAVLFQLGQLAAASYLFNNLMKSLTGSSVMFDPIDMLKELLGLDDDDEEKSLDERAFEVFGDFMDNVPMASIFTGGRVPISEAFTGATTAFKKFTNQKDKYGNDITYEDIKNDMISSAFYWLLPTGYGQIKKTTKGSSMYDKKLPLPGSYTDSGNLRFNADESTGGKIKAVLFGQYSSEEAQKYVDSGYKSINKNYIEEMKELKMDSSEYRNYRNGLSRAGKKVIDKTNYINNLDLDYDKKNIMLSNILYDDKAKDKLKSVNDMNMSEIDKNKYFTAQAKISESKSDKDNKNKKKEISEIIVNTNLSDKYMAHLYGNYYSNEETLNNLLTMNIPIKEFIKLNSEDLSGDYNTKTGKTISGSKKNKVINYVNSLKLSIPQKAILIKSQYSTYKNYDKEIISYVNKINISANDKKMLLKSIGFNNYNNDIVNYINSQNMSKTEKEKKLKSLGFTIRDGRVYW